MAELKTEARLVERLRAAAARGVSRDELKEQRVSFVYGNLPKGSPMTRHEVRERLDRVGGTVAA